MKESNAEGQVELEPLEDGQLIDLFVRGNEQAFNQLVLRHRSQVYRWAYAVTKDTYLAEDIVQNTFILVHQKLHTLQDKDRFLPWLKRIVQNQSYSHFRKKDNSGFVKPFSSFQGHGATGGYNHESEYGQSEAKSLELIGQWIGIDDVDSLPDTVAQNERLNTVKELFMQLSPQARQVAEAFFIQELTAEEMAAFFNSKTSRIYNTLSKAKKKLQNIGFEAEINRFIQVKQNQVTKSIDPTPTAQRGFDSKNMATGGRCILDVPKQTSSYTSMAHVIFQLLQYTKNVNYSMTEVMGFSGQAFRLQMAPGGDSIGLYYYEWGHVFKQSLTNLGFRSTFIGHPYYQELTPDSIIASIELIQSSIQTGLPALAWNLTPAEFNLIYGYDDEQKQFIYRDVANKKNVISYDLLGRHIKDTDLFIAIIEGPITHYPLHYEKIFEPRQVRDPRERGRDEGSEGTPSDKHNQWSMWFGPSFIMAIQSVLAHMKAEEKQVEGHTVGLNAYDTWIQALQQNQMDGIGHAYQVALISEARYHALEFLKQMGSVRIFRSDSRHERYVALMDEAKQLYEEIYQEYMKIYPSFPYTLQLSAPEQREKLILSLKKCRDLETRAISIFENISELL